MSWLISNDMKNPIYKSAYHYLFFSCIVFLQGCALTPDDTISGNKHDNDNLTIAEQKIVDTWVREKVPECRFIYSHTANKKVIDSIRIISCIDHFFISSYSRKPPYDFPDSINKKIKYRELDKTIGKKLTPFFDELPPKELTNILAFLIHMIKGENHYLIKSLVDKGADTQDILLSNILTASVTSESNTCLSSLIILQANRKLYQNKKNLNTFVKYHFKLNNHTTRIKSDTNYKLSSGYRRDDLYKLLVDPAYLKCLEPVIAVTLLEINPDLRDVVHSEDGGTALHNYAQNFAAFKVFEKEDSTGQRIDLANKLISKNNINIQNKEGQTPLHLLLTVYSPLSKERLAFAKAIVHAGADLDLKDKKGVSVRDLMLKYPGLVPLL